MFPDASADAGADADVGTPLRIEVPCESMGTSTGRINAEASNVTREGHYASIELVESETPRSVRAFSCAWFADLGAGWKPSCPLDSCAGDFTMPALKCRPIPSDMLSFDEGQAIAFCGERWIVAPDDGAPFTLERRLFESVVFAID